MQYPLWNVAAILGLSLITIPLFSAFNHYLSSEEYGFEIVIEGWMVLLFILGILISVVTIILWTIATRKAKRESSRINLMSVYPPELNENDEGMSYITHEGLRKVYAFYSLALPVLVCIFFLIPNNYFTKLNVMLVVLGLALVQNVIYYLSTRHLMKEEI
ncbi:hypothetical protein GCM10007190_14990 [Macrococcus hajekii]|nr:hypothetical protein GCM10007190_14990 [Macrococcus hajekii]